MWAPRLSVFPDRRTVASDARSHGASSEVNAPLRLADDVVALLDASEIEKAVLAGVSIGGGTAVDVALEYLAGVDALVVGGTGTSEPEFADPWVLNILAAWKEAETQGDAEAWIAAFMRFTHGPERDVGDADPDVWGLVTTMVHDTLMQHVVPRDDDASAPPVTPTPVTGAWGLVHEITVPVGCTVRDR